MAVSPGEILSPRQPHPRDLPEFFDDEKDIVPGRRKTCPDGRPAEVHHAETFLALERPPPVAGDRLREGREFRAEGHGNRFLHLRSADLDDGAEGLLFLLKGPLEVGNGLAEPPEAGDGGDLQGRRIDVVCGLVEVHVLQRMDETVIALPAMKELDRPIGDHLVDVHVRRGAGPSLEGINGELVREAPGGNLPAGRDDRLPLLRGEISQFEIGESAGLLDEGKGPDQARADRPAADGKITDRAPGVDAPVGVDRDLQDAEEILFPSCRFSIHMR